MKWKGMMGVKWMTIANELEFKQFLIKMDINVKIIVILIIKVVATYK